MPSGITGRDGFLPALVKSIRRSFPCRHPTTGGSLKGSPAGTPLTHRFLYYPYSTTAAAVCQPSFCPGPQPAGRRDGPSGEFARNVGLSNRLDGELVGRAPEEGPHGEVVGAAVVDRKLLCEIVQKIECVAGIESFLVLAVATLLLAVVPRVYGQISLCRMPSSAAVRAHGLQHPQTLVADDELHAIQAASAEPLKGTDPTGLVLLHALGGS